MAFTIIPVQASAKATGATCAFRTSNAGTYYEIVLGLSKPLVAQWPGVTPGSLRVLVEHDPEANLLRLTPAPASHPKSRATRCNQHRRKHTSCTVAFPLPDIFGDKRPAEPVEVKMDGCALIIHLPEWAQAPRYRKAKLERVA
jgi:hypothetical protein